MISGTHDAMNNMNSTVTYQTLLDEAIQMNQEFQLLCNLQNIIVDKLDIKQLSKTAVKTIHDLFHYDQVSLGLVQDDYLVTMASKGFDRTIKPPKQISVSNQRCNGCSGFLKLCSISWSLSSSSLMRWICGFISRPS